MVDKSLIETDKSLLGGCSLYIIIWWNHVLQCLFKLLDCGGKSPGLRGRGGGRGRNIYGTSFDSNIVGVNMQSSANSPDNLGLRNNSS